MEHSLTLSTALDAQGVETMLHALNAVRGVRAVETAAGSSQVKVRYDDGLTSPQEISATVLRSGFALERPAPRAGGCCGSCGGM
jgi:copper chaperone CopZ